MPPDHLQYVIDDLESFGIRNLWHGFFPTLVVAIVYDDLVLGRRLIVRLLKFLILQLHCLWIQHYNVVHSIVTDEASFEELIDLKAEVNEIKLTPEYESLVSSK